LLKKIIALHPKNILNWLPLTAKTDCFYCIEVIAFWFTNAIGNKLRIWDAVMKVFLWV